jgi:Zn-dependent alcohol dehydrogenase
LRVEGDCVLGHEASGIILKVGDGVEGFIPGKSLPSLHTPCNRYRLHIAVGQTSLETIDTEMRI